MTRFRGFALGVLVGFIAISVVGMVVSRNMALDGTYTYLRLFNEALSLIRNSYVEEVDTDELLEGAYKGLVSELDPFSEYLTPREYQEYMQSLVEKPRPRRGADVGLELAKKNEVVIVVSVRRGSDAESKDVTAGDRLRRIGDRPVREMTLGEIEKALSPAAGTSVPVEFLRMEEPHKLEVDLVSTEPEPEPIALAVLDGGIGTLRIPGFGGNAVARIEEALARAEKGGVERLLIDLRGNTSKETESAVEAAGLFVGEGVVARLSGRDGQAAELRSRRGRAPYDGSIALLIDTSTADAAELFAAALREGRDATLMGERSFGVGAEQELIPLKNGAYLKLSVRKYTSQSGSAWHGEGLDPDIAIEVSRKDFTGSKRLEEQMRRAIEEVRTLGSSEEPAKAAMLRMAS